MPVAALVKLCTASPAICERQLIVDSIEPEPKKVAFVHAPPDSVEQRLER
jgi:hypothetical protein